MAALPFLPRGKGALILIQGGLVMLGFSLLWTLVTPRPAPAHLGAHSGRTRPYVAPARAVVFQEKVMAPTPTFQVHAPAVHAPVVHTPVVPTMEAPVVPLRWEEVEVAPSYTSEVVASAQSASETWIGSPLELQMRPMVGRTRLLSATPSWFILTVISCRSCRTGMRGPSGCDAERGHIQAAVMPTAPQARVTEVSCNLLNNGGCTFKVERGRMA